jgi:hypothetical protein
MATTTFSETDLEMGVYTEFGTSEDGLSAIAAENIEEGGYFIAFFKEAMPAHHAVSYADLASLYAAMQEIAPLTSWKLCDEE